MTLCLVVRTMEGIAVATDTTTSTQIQIDGINREFHTYYRRKLVAKAKFAIVQTGIAFINNKTIAEILEGAELPEDSITVFIEKIVEVIGSELYLDSSLLLGLPVGDNINPFLVLGVVGYTDERPETQSIEFRIGINPENNREVRHLIRDPSSGAPTPYGISYFGDYRFVQLVIQAAIDANLLKPFDLLTLREALDLARILLKFLIDFQKFLIISTVDYPIESVVITRHQGVQSIDKMRIDPLSDI